MPRLLLLGCLLAVYYAPAIHAWQDTNKPNQDDMRFGLLQSSNYLFLALT